MLTFCYVYNSQYLLEHMLLFLLVIIVNEMLHDRINLVRLLSAAVMSTIASDAIETIIIMKM